MRSEVDAPRIQRLLKELGRRARGPGRIYLTGGASALLEGWRATTIDIDLKLDPEPAGIFEAIAELKNELDLNIELASPDQFLPSLAGWRERSVFITRHGSVEFFHYDFRAQALSKLARGLERDISDVQAMLHRGLVSKRELTQALEEILPGLVRYPSLDADALEADIRLVLEDLDD